MELESKQLKEYIKVYKENYASFIRQNSKSEDEYNISLKYNEYMTGEEYYEPYDIKKYNDLYIMLGSSFSGSIKGTGQNYVTDSELRMLDNDELLLKLQNIIKHKAKFEPLNELMLDYEGKLKDEKTKTQICYRARMDRRLYSSFLNKSIIPNYDNIIRLCFGLKLNIDDSNKLLKSCGYTFTSSNRDAVITFMLKQQIYDVHECNKYLEKYKLKLLKEDKAYYDYEE